MRLLTVRHPHASFIVHGLGLAKERVFKDVENRSWTTTYRGPLLIHASATKTAADYHAAVSTVLDRFSVVKPTDPGDWMDAWEIVQDNAPFKHGYIIGAVTIVDVVRDSKSKWAMPDAYHWCLANPVAFEPIAWKGAQGLRQVPLSLEDTVRRQIPTWPGFIEEQHACL